MKITKLGHCCLVIDTSTELSAGENGLRILTDPGSYSTAQNEVKNIDVVLITHEHKDHLHIDSLKAVLKNNPQSKVITNKSVGALLEKEDIAFGVVEDSQSSSEKGVLIEGFGEKHADIYPTVPVVDNTGYFIANRLFYPGDAFTNPAKPVDILALPVAGPWMRIAGALDYAKKIKPKTCFPVHDGMLCPDHRLGPAHRLPEAVLSPIGIRFVAMKEGSEEKF